MQTTFVIWFSVLHFSVLVQLCFACFFHIQRIPCKGAKWVFQTWNENYKIVNLKFAFDTLRHYRVSLGRHKLCFNLGQLLLCLVKRIKIEIFIFTNLCRKWQPLTAACLPPACRLGWLMKCSSSHTLAHLSPGQGPRAAPAKRLAFASQSQLPKVETLFFLSQNLALSKCKPDVCITCCNNNNSCW